MFIDSRTETVDVSTAGDRLKDLGKQY